MSWIILEGIDRTGKTSVAEYYKKKGFKVIHFNAPSKKYFDSNYVGNSYFDDMHEVYLQYIGQNIVFDRSIYGELVWPTVYGRKAMLDDESFEILREIEESEGTKRILLYDPNTKAHWNRCVDNNENLNKSQFLHAAKLYESLVDKYCFLKKTMNDFIEETPKEETPKIEPIVKQETPIYSEEQMLLEKANAINSVLSKRILKKSGSIYDDLEKDIRSFLSNKMSQLFNKPSSNVLTDEEIRILKNMCSTINNKMGGK